MILFSLFTPSAWADVAEAAGHHAIVIPWSSLLVQAFNVIVLFGVLAHYLRPTLATHFAKRAEDYRKLVTQAEAARVEAERGKREVEARLAKLEGEARDTEGSAVRESRALREKMMAEAETFAKKIEREAEWSAHMVIEKARAAVRTELLARAMSGATESLRGGLGQSEQRRLQDEFAEKIQVVGR